MSRNSNSYFSETPARVDLPRSTIMRNQEHKTTFNTGELIPFYIDEVLPGSTHQIDTSIVCRLQTLLNPIMDNLFLDTYYFFVPNRLVWDHWQEFCGENKTGSWTQEVEYSIPQIVAPIATEDGETSNGFDKGSLADYFGIPTGVPLLKVNALPFRAYALICNDFFRDENLQDPLNIPTNDSEVTGISRAYAPYEAHTANNEYTYGAYINNVAKGALPFKVNKTHDYFTSCLPAPQKTTDPIGISLANLTEPIGVVGNGSAIGFDYGSSEGKVAVIKATNGTSAAVGYFDSPPSVGTSTDGTTPSSKKNLGLSQSSADSNILVDFDSLSSSTLITINQLRQAFQVQKFYERQAYGGTRYIEILKSMFGVTSPDARLQRPEYLGGKRIPIAVQQVIQSSETGDTPQGNTAAYSLTSDYQKSISKSFVEHGYIIGLACVRYNHTYQNGLERMWSRKTKFDFYWPLFASLGNVPVLRKEILALDPQTLDPDSGNPSNDEVFGYQEAWADYRYKPNRVSGEMRSNYSATLDSWHLADDYFTDWLHYEVPYLSEDWIREDGGTVDRVLAVSQRLSDQFLADFYVKNKTTQPMPVYSIPGLIDHH